MFFRLFARAPRTTIAPRVGLRAATAASAMAPLAAQVRAGQRRRSALGAVSARRRPLEDHVAAVLAGAGPEVDDVVGRADRLLVVLDDDDRVAEIAQPREASPSSARLSRWCRPIDGSSST